MRRVAAWVAVLGVVALAALMLGPALLGYQRYVITGGSMGGALPRGSIAYERPVPVARVQPGDVITNVPPGRGERVTHRVVAIGSRGAVRTAGDANAAADPWRARLTGDRQAVVRFHIPLAGYALAALGLRPVRMALIGLPALLAAAAALGGLRRPETA